MRYIIYGAGAIGGAIGGRLFQHGRDVVLIARGEHARALGERGLRLTTPDETLSLRIPVVDHPARLDLGDGDVVLLTMKSQQTAAALRDLVPLAPASLPIVCAQNGVENERVALRSFANVHAMCVMLPAERLEPGAVVAYGGPLTGVVHLGLCPSGTDSWDARIAADLETSRFSSRPLPDVMRYKYAKLLQNLRNVIDATSGAEARESQLYRRAKGEALECYRAGGIAFASDDEFRERRGDLVRTMPVGGAQRRGGSSWQSLVRGTGNVETDYLNGEIVLLGRMLGVPTPVNAMFQRVVNRMLRDGTPPGSLRVEDLERELRREARSSQ